MHIGTNPGFARRGTIIYALDEHYINPKLAEIYDLDSGWSEDREFYLNLAGPAPQDILDLGCGTGLLCDAYAASGHRVTGVEPSPAMLDVARRKKHGNEIEWVQCFAQDFKSEKRFDLIIMTGHAFQVLLEDEDVIATLEVMRVHLKTGGRAVFESRNPRIDWAKTWNYEMTLQTPAGEVRETRKLLNFNGERMEFELAYEFPDEVLRSASALRFLSHGEIEYRATTAGLILEEVWGGWDKQPFDELTSSEMIFSFR